MSAFVVDSSVALSWCFDDEASPQTNALLDEVLAAGAVVPALWHTEVGNVLLQAERRGRIAPADVAARLELLGALPIITEQVVPARAWHEVMALARAESLTVYDASYLELAVRRGLTLLTNDRELTDAARRLGVAVLPGQ